MKDYELQISRLVNNVINRRLVDLHTALPGIVEKFDPLTLTADIQIAIKRQTTDGEEEEIAVLPSIPIVYPRTESFSFFYPLEAGDTVQLIFNERALDNFKFGSKGDIASPSSVPRFHNYMDAVAIPSIVPFSEGVTNFNLFRRQSTSAFIAHAGGFMGIDSTGKIYLGKEDGTENEPLVLGTVLTSAMGDLYDKVSTLLAKVDAGFTKLAAGPIALGNLGAPAPTYPTLAADLTAISVELAALDGEIAADKTKYVTAPATNIVSQIAFTERG